MKRFFAPLSLIATCVATLALSACGGAKTAGEAGADSVEMAAEEALGGLDASATPVVDTAANSIPDSSGTPAALTAPTITAEQATSAASATSPAAKMPIAPPKE